MSPSDLWYPQRLSTIFCLKKNISLYEFGCRLYSSFIRVETWVVRPKDQDKIVIILLYFPFILENLWVLFLFLFVILPKGLNGFYIT